MPTKDTTSLALTGPILVGIGSDALGDHAVQRGVQLASMLDTSVELVHGVPETTMYGMPVVGEWRGAVDSNRLLTAQRVLASHLEALSTESETDVNAVVAENLRVLPGKPARVLLDRAREIDAGIVVLGQRRRRKVIDRRRTARAVLTHAKCPVWIQPEKVTAVGRVIVPVDFSDASEAALRLGIQVAQLFATPVTVMHCFVGPDFAYAGPGDTTAPTYVVREQRQLARADLQDFTERQPWGSVEHVTAFFEDEPSTRIVDMQDPGDVIVMATHGRGAISAAFLGSVTYDVLREARGPVVAVPPTNKHS